MKSILNDFQERRRQKQHRQKQGRLNAAEALAQLPQENLLLPLALLKDGQKNASTVGVAAERLGHMLVVGPPDSGCSWHLTHTLRLWPFAALVVDPTDLQYRRTGQTRQVHYGTVFHTPGYKFHLGGYYSLHDPLDAQRLHRYLMFPCQPDDRDGANRALSLFIAIGRFAAVKQRNGVRVLLDAANSNVRAVLQGLEQVEAAREHLYQFTDGLNAAEAVREPAVAAHFAAFARLLQPYQSHYDMVCPLPTGHDGLVIPPGWVKQKCTLYLTHDEEVLRETVGMFAAIISALLRYHMTHGDYRPLLLVLNQTMALRLRHLDSLLEMVGKYGIVVLLYVPSLAGLRSVVGAEQLPGFLTYFAHQIWYAPREPETAEILSGLYGTKLSTNKQNSPSPGYEQENGERKGATTEPVLTPVEMMALPRDNVVVLTQTARQVRFIAQATEPPFSVAPLPPPLPPRPKFQVRKIPDWLPQLPRKAEPPWKTQVPSSKSEKPEQSTKAEPGNRTAADAEPNSHKRKQGRFR
jgi:hypothetical protein